MIYSYGLRVIADDWLRSYLSCHSQYVVYDKTESEPKSIVCAVPQGSILWPLLFLLYINYMPTISKIILPILFADDTNVLMSGSNVGDLISSVNREIVSITEWLDANELSLNVSKTQYTIFRSPGMGNPIVKHLLITKMRLPVSHNCDDLMQNMR